MSKLITKRKEIDATGQFVSVSEDTVMSAKPMYSETTEFAIQRVQSIIQQSLSNFENQYLESGELSAHSLSSYEVTFKLETINHLKNIITDADSITEVINGITHLASISDSAVELQTIIDQLKSIDECAIAIQLSQLNDSNDMERLVDDRGQSYQLLNASLTQLSEARSAKISD